MDKWDQIRLVQVTAHFFVMVALHFFTSIILLILSLIIILKFSIVNFKMYYKNVKLNTQGIYMR